MRKRQPINLTASVRQRLLNRAREKGEDFNLVLTRYALERLLYRLARSQYADRFVLKGAMLFAVWANRVYRPTRDLDLLGYGDSSQQMLTKVFQEICLTDVEPDGLAFDAGSVRMSEIREDQEYGGCRVQLVAYLANAQINLHIDIGFGDVVRPEAEEIDYPTLLDFPAPRVWAYPPKRLPPCSALLAVDSCYSFACDSSIGSQKNINDILQFRVGLADARQELSPERSPAVLDTAPADAVDAQFIGKLLVA